MRRVALNTKGVKFIQGQRYLANTKTGVTFPYSPAFASNPDIQEIFPEYKEEGKGSGVPEPVVQELSLDEPVEFDPIIVTVPEAETAPATDGSVATPAQDEATAEEPEAPAKNEEKPVPPAQKMTPQERMDYARNMKNARKGK